MLNYLWSVMILIGMIYGAFTGNLDTVTQGLLDSAKDAVTLGLTMLGIMSFWCGILEIGNSSGLVKWLTGKMSPVLNFLFPQLPKDHPARRPMAVNMVANMLGLGMAATPAGLEAMKELKRDQQLSNRASSAMCTFLIINISSLQLVPITIVAYRSQYGSAEPAAVLGPALLATICSTVTAVIFCKIMDLWNSRDDECNSVYTNAKRSNANKKE